MKKLIIGFIILLFAVWVGFLIHRDPGYVLVTYGTWSVEASLWVGIAIILITFLILYTLLRLFRHTKKLGHKIQEWGRGRTKRKAVALTDRGLFLLAEAYWEKAEKNLTRAVNGSDRPLINYLAAAKAANALHAFDRRDNYLKKAHLSEKEATLAIGLTQTQLQISNQEWEAALNSLNHLHEHAPNHPYILELLYKTLIQLEDWEQLNGLLPSLRKNKVLTDNDLTTLEETVHVGILFQADGPEKLETLWQNMPKALQFNPAIISMLACQALQHHKESVALTAIERALKKQWAPTLAALYGDLHGESNAKQLSLAESWLKKHPNDPELLHALAKLSMREQYWSKAKEYLDAALNLSPTPETYHTLATVYQALNEDKQALDCYRKATPIQ